MKRYQFLLLLGALVFATTYMTADDNPATKASDADIRAHATAFCKAYNSGDAAAVAAFYTEGCEYSSDTGEVLRGRAELEKAYREHFKNNRKGTMSIEIESIRFPARNLAVEEGTIETRNSSAELPSSTRYQAVHVLVDGQWKTALSQEWGAEVDKLMDLNWLIGTWTGKSKDRETRISFEWNDKKNVILSKYTVKEGDKVVSSGTQRIHQNQQTGGLRALSYDDAGGHGEANWFRDGNRWVAQTSGVSPSGTTTQSINLLSRLEDNAILWYSVDRFVDGKPVPYSAPIKLTRSK